MVENSQFDERILILAPVGGDGPAMATLLTERGLAATVCQGATELHLHMRRGAGAVLLTEEALERAQFSEFLDELQSQPSWSELPLIILTHGGESRVARLLDMVAAAAGGVTVLERPIGLNTLVRAVEVAIRSRRRQYQVRDLIAESKRNLEELKASESRFAVFVDLIPTLAWMANADGWIFWYNQRWYEYTGTREEEMQGWGWQAVHDPVVLPSVMERWTESIRMGKPFEMVFPLKGADGVFRSFITRIIPATDADGNVTRWFGTNTEIDELQSTREALAKTQERLQLAQNAGRLATWDWNLAADKFFWTGDVMSVYGCSAESVASTDAIKDCIHPNDREATFEAARLAIENGTEYNCEFRVVWPDQSIHWVAGRGRAIYGQDHRPTAMIGTNWDITRIKLAEEALRKNEKLAVAGRFAATIAHEINNPLEAVTNLLYLVRTNLQDEQVREYAVTAEEELRRVSLIVNQSLRFHRQSTFLTEETVSSILESAIGIYKTRLTASQIEVRRDYQDRHLARCYASELRQVFGNFIGNAFDAVRQSGIICLRTRDVKDFLTGEPGVRITVADSGHGMDAQTLARISEPFFTTKGINGTGLGLWISRDILQKHHAKMRVRSREGDDRSGTVFSIFLPLDAIRKTETALRDAVWLPATSENAELPTGESSEGYR